MLALATATRVAHMSAFFEALRTADVPELYEARLALLGFGERASERDRERESQGNDPRTPATGNLVVNTSTGGAARAHRRTRLVDLHVYGAADGGARFAQLLARAHQLNQGRLSDPRVSEHQDADLVRMLHAVGHGSRSKLASIMCQ